MIGNIITAARASIEKMKWPLKLAGDKLYEQGAKLIKLFRPAAKEITEAQLIERSSVEILKTIKSFKDFKFVDPYDLNMIIQKGTKGIEPAFDIKFGALRGILAEEKEFIRFIKHDPRQRYTHTGWMIPASIVEGLTPEQIKQVLAIKYVPTHSVKVTVSEGVEVVMGRIAENSMGGQKEVMQLWIDHLDKYLKNVSFGSPQPLNKAFKR